jgi:hypothetical protein
MKTIAIPAALFALLLVSSGIAQAQGPRSGGNYTPGWAMMSPQERDEHRKRMAEARTPEQCGAARDDHRRLMEERAKERGMASLPVPRRDACAGFKS